MAESSEAAFAPYEGAHELREANAQLLQALDQRLGRDSRPESEISALLELEPSIREFLERGARTGAYVEDIKERTACQVMLDYWSSTLSHAGAAVARPRFASFDAAQLPDLKDRPCPFVGLEPFREGMFFFGRDKAVESLLARVAEVPLVVVQGASGSGKSSLVIGGVLPLLGGAPAEAQRYRVVGPFTPGNTPLEGLVGAFATALADAGTDATTAAAGSAVIDVTDEAAVLRREPARLVALLDAAQAGPALVVVDQFEEVFTLCSEGDRDALVAGLDALLQARPDDRVILTVREEFSNELDRLEPLRPYLARHARFSMKEWAMGYDELKAAVERPAALVNLQFAPGLVDEMVKSVLGRDTALPLLQFALRALWEGRDRNRITREVYAGIGGSPLVALERFADRFYDGLLRERKDEVERILLELVRIDRMLEPYRRPRLRSELLAGGNPRTPEVLELLEREHFIRVTPTAGGRDAAVEVKHEALLRNWPRYIGWISRKREEVRQRIALNDAARRWAEAGSSPTEGLLSAWQLKEAQQFSDLGEVEQRYVQASEAAADRERVAREQMLRRQERRKWMLGIAAVVVGVVVAWGMYADRQRERRLLGTEVLASVARANAASARGRLDDAMRQMLRATAAMRRFEIELAPWPLVEHLKAWAGWRGHSAEVRAMRMQMRGMVISGLRDAADVQRVFVADGSVFQAVAFDPTRSDAVLAIAGDDETIHLVELDTGLEQALTACPAAVATTVAFDPRGRFLAVGCSDGTLSSWSTADWQRLGVGNVPAFEGRKIWAIAVSPDGRTIAAGGYRNHVALVAVDEDGALSAQPVQKAGGDFPLGYVWSLAFSPAGETLLVGDGVGKVLECSASVPDAWQCRKTEAYPGTAGSEEASDAIRALAFSADGTQVAVGHWQGGVEVWGAGFEPASRRAVDVGVSLGPVHSLGFFEASGRRQLAIGKGVGLLYRPVDAVPADAERPPPCASPRSASIGDEAYGVAVHVPSGSIAAATRGGYVAVLDPDQVPDPLRRTLPAVEAGGSGPLRGAIVAEQGPTAWLAVPVVPRAADGTNLELHTLGDPYTGDDREPLRLVAGDATIQRLSASTRTRHLATLGCRASGENGACRMRDPFEVGLWRLNEDSLTLAPVAVLGPDDFVGPDDFDGLVPRRVVLSPDGQWLVLAFRSSNWMLLVAANDADSRRWIDAGLERVREIAFSHDGTFFGAGGEPKSGDSTESDDEVRLWRVNAAGLEPMPHGALVLSPAAHLVYELGFAADARGRTLLLAGGNGVIERWDATSGRRLEPLRTDSWPVYLLAYAPDAGLLAAANSQNVLYLWDTASSVALQLTPSTDAVARPGFLAFHGGGSWLATGADTVRLWTLDIEALERRYCALLRLVDRGKAVTGGSLAALVHDSPVCRAP